MTYDAVLIAGPTASGKSQAALAVASTIAAGIVNADAMQIYRELRILTARPSDDEMARARHGLYGHVSVNQAYSVGRYQTDANPDRRKIFRTARQPVRPGCGIGRRHGNDGHEPQRVHEFVPFHLRSFRPARR